MRNLADLLNVKKCLYLDSFLMIRTWKIAMHIFMRYHLLAPFTYLRQFSYHSRPSKDFLCPQGRSSIPHLLQSLLIQEYACKIFQDLQQTGQVSLDNFQRKRSNLVPKSNFNPRFNPLHQYSYYLRFSLHIACGNDSESLFNDRRLVS